VIVPAGYERLLQAHAVAVARSDIIPSIRQALVGSDGTRSTLHEFAARAHGARPLQGRGTAWAIQLPGGSRAVVRHNRHGGLLAPLTGDRFLSPTRAPHELAVSLALRARAVRTPEVLAYVLYPPGAVFQRSDVATAEVAGGRDLADILRDQPRDAREAAFRATADLLAALSRAGARHHDLNAKNVLVAPEGAYVLDVDRITLGEPSPAALDGNLARLTRSLRKWRDRFGVDISDAEIASIEAGARAGRR
jgi:3-deoxy-D-manno-octulosonic acid kinase